MSVLPAGVRRRVVELAADRLGALAPDDVPGSLRAFARFAPAKRARLAATPLAAALETDPDFRDTVADGVRLAFPELVAALEAGGAVPAADPDDVAALAYLLRSPGWERYVEDATVREQAADERRAAEAVQREAGRQDAAVEAELRRLREKIVELEERVQRALADVASERERARAAAERARRAETALAEVSAGRVEEVDRAERAAAAAEGAQRQIAERLSEAEATLERVRRDTRDAREAADIRRWLLLDTLARAAQGLREELAPAPPVRRPADLVAAAVADAGGTGPAPAADDPATVDLLLRLPNAHLVVDGYNVTKTGYPDLPLEDQRARLVTGLAGLVGRTRAEVTCVFDGAQVAMRVPAAALRTVRVRFSPPGETADELIRQLVRAEPTGRPVTVCSADREVVDGVVRFGARVVTPTALLTKLDQR